MATTMMQQRTSKKRGRRRGAAMVEAVPVLTVMIVFMGVTMFMYRAYKQKLVEETKTRTDSLTVASHACEGGGGGSEEPTGAGVDGQAAGIADRVSGGRTGGSMMMQSVTKTGSATVNGSAVVSLKRTPLQGQVSAWSTIVCRPKPESWGDMFMGGLSSLRGVVGL